MGIFSRFKKEKPKNHLSTSRNYFWGGSTSGTYVNEQTAMQTSAVYTCVRVISEALASLPLHVYEYNDSGAKMVTDHYLYDLLHFEPNPEMSSFVFRETLMSHLLIYGNAYAQILRDEHGRVTALYPLSPSKMDVCRSPKGEIYYTYWRESDEARAEKQGGVALRYEDVMHIPGLSFDGLIGYSPVALAKNAIGMAIATEEYGASFFANGANPSGILEHPGELNNQETIRETWETLFGGKGNHRVAVLEEGMKFHPVSIPPEEAQFLETRKFQLNEIARIFRIPPHMIGDLEKSSFSNIEQQSLEFVKYTVEPWVIRWEQEMHRSLLLPSERRKISIRFNVDGLLRGDYKTRQEGYSVGIQNGYLSPNDARRLENMNPIPHPSGDKYYINGNMLPLEDAGAYAKKERD